MQNHPLVNPATGKVEWVARNIAVLVMVIGMDKNHRSYVLANKRGPETPDPEFRGCWCMPCGYLDYDETIKMAAVLTKGRILINFRVRPYFFLF